MSSKSSLSSAMKMKSFFLGFWKSVFLSFQSCTLTVKKAESSPDVELSISITQSTEIKQLKPEEQFSIQPPNSKIYLFQAATPEDAVVWVNTLRSSVFPVDSPTRFNVVSVIGRGYYGKVMLVKDLPTGELCAVKTIHKSRLIETRKVGTVITERNILLTAKHPFIVGLRFAFQTDKKFYLGMEFVPGGELFRLMNVRKSIPMDDVRLYLAEISLALQYLHSIGVVYRDLKPENILISKDGHIKLTDFGLSKSLSNNDSTSTFVGTSEYLAPEVIERKPYSFDVDWWSLGVLAYEMVTGTTPFYDTSRVKMFEKIVRAATIFPDGADPTLVDFISRLLSKDPKQRMRFGGIAIHPFMSSIDFEAVARMEISPSYVPDCSKVTDNFDSEFTCEQPIDSKTTSGDGLGIHFKGFSFSGFSSEQNPQISPLIEANLIQPKDIEEISK